MIQIAFGGQVAEELFFGDVSTGPSGDLAYATTVAAQMVGAAGMAGSSVSFAAVQDSGFSGTDLVGKVLADGISRERVEQLLDEQKSVAHDLLGSNRHLVAALRDALLTPRGTGRLGDHGGARIGQRAQPRRGGPARCDRGERAGTVVRRLAAWRRSSRTSRAGCFWRQAILVLFVGGGVLGLFGAFLLPTSVSSAYAAPAPISGPGGASHVLAAGGGGGLGQLLSLGLLIAVLGNPALSIAGLWMAGSRLAATMPLLGWLAVVLPLGSVTSEGNNVLPGTLRSAAFLLLGIIGFVAVAIVAKPSRGVTSFGGQSAADSGWAGAGRPAAGWRAAR